MLVLAQRSGAQDEVYIDVPASTRPRRIVVRVVDARAGYPRIGFAADDCGERIAINRRIVAESKERAKGRVATQKSA